LQLTDYYAWEKPVLSPIRGWVTWVVRDLPDGTIGSVDSDNNWGNYVVLYDERGFYVEISHFAQDSIVVNPGDRIERGSLIGRCGNSGYSPQPHIHIQVQLTPQIGSATVPFCFTNLIVDGEFFTEHIPAENTLLEPISCDTALLKSLTFTLDSQLHFNITEKGRAVGQLVATVRMAKDSSLYLDSGRGKLFFSRDDDKFMFHRLEGNDSALKLLFLAIPKIPLVRGIEQQWFDYLPISTVISGWRRRFYQFCSSFYPQLASAKYVGQWQSNGILTGTVAIPKVPSKISTSATFDCNNQLMMVIVGDKALVRLQSDIEFRALTTIQH
jgi:Peptidase family M23